MAWLVGTPWPGVEAVAGALPQCSCAWFSCALCVSHPAGSGTFASTAMISGSSLAVAEEKMERWVCPKGVLLDHIPAAVTLIWVSGVPKCRAQARGFAVNTQSPSSRAGSAAGLFDDAVALPPWQSPQSSWQCKFSWLHAKITLSY